MLSRVTTQLAIVVYRHTEVKILLLLEMLVSHSSNLGWYLGMYRQYNGLDWIQFEQMSQYLRASLCSEMSRSLHSPILEDSPWPRSTACRLILSIGIDLAS
jgi:hypothetical protein